MKFLATTIILLFSILNLVGQNYQPYRPSELKAISPSEYSNENLLKTYQNLNYDLDSKVLTSLTGETSEILKRHHYLHSDEGSLEYWQELLQKLSNEFIQQLDNKIDIQVLMSMSPELNAYAMGAGYLIINTGLIAEVSNEEELALVLAHEIAHNYLNHVYQSAVTNKNSQSAVDISSLLGPIGTMTTLAISKSTINKKSRALESQADSLGAELIVGSNIDISKAVPIYDYFDLLEQKGKISPNTKTFFLFGQTHPGSKERIDEILKKTKASKQKYISEDSKFLEMRQAARIEKVNQLTRSMRFEQAIECAWKYLSETPNDQNLKEILLECLRLFKKYRNENIMNNMVLFDNYSYEDFSTSTFKKGNLSEKQKELVTIIFGSSQISENSFFDFDITYKQMFDKLLIDVSKSPSNEALLTLALTKEKMDEELLQKYIDNNGRYKLYAKFLLGDIDFSQKQKMSYTIIPSIKARKQKSLGSYFYRNMSITEILENYDYSEIGKFKNATLNNEVYFFKDYENFSFRDLREMSTIYAFSYQLAQLTEEKIPYSFMYPEFIEFFIRNDIQRIHFFESSGTHGDVGKNEIVSVDISDNVRFYQESSMTMTYTIGAIPKKCNKLMSKADKNFQ